MKKKISLFLVLIVLTSLSSVALADIQGLGMVTQITSSKPATADANGVAQADTTVCAVTLGENNIITKISFDVVQAKVAINNQGEIVADMAADIKTKMELKDDYGMRKASPIGKEIHEQIEALENWCVGKNADEIISKELAKDDADLLAGCTISIDAYMVAMGKAVMNAK